ncbi:Probable imidazolonepropionase [Sparganum proliferum]
MIDCYDTFQVTGVPNSHEKYAIILDSDGNILSYGLEDHITCPTFFYSKIIDCKGGAVLPDTSSLSERVSCLMRELGAVVGGAKELQHAGISRKGGFIDAHAYPIWAGDRVPELVQKQAAGAFNLEMQETWVGINRTAETTKMCLESVLYESCLARFRTMVKNGTTTVECKTGYGLTWENEERLLRILTRLKRDLPIDLSITFYAASTKPKNMTTEEFVDHIVEEQIPSLKKLMDTGEVCVHNIDVRSKEGYFTAEQTRRIISAGTDIGLNANFHVGEDGHIKTAELAASLKARAVSHLDNITPAGVAALTTSETAAILLPITSLFLHRHPPPAVSIAQAGVPIVLGTNFNPGQYCSSMPFVMYLACATLGLTLEQALIAVTLNAAYSINLSHKLGAITEGRQGDFVIINTRRWEHIILRHCETEDLIEYVIKKGKIIYSQHLVTPSRCVTKSSITESMPKKLFMLSIEHQQTSPEAYASYSRDGGYTTNESSVTLPEDVDTGTLSSVGNADLR